LNSLCEKCKKNQATFHLTAIEKNVKKEAHLCEGCAKQTGIGYKFNFSIGNLLGSTLGKAAKGSKSKCPNCGFTLADIQKQMRVGCGNDYELFKEELSKVLQQIHGASTHIGKVPGPSIDPRVHKEVEMVRLKKDLDQVVKDEKYEEAARLRDRIRVLEADLNPPPVPAPSTPAPSTEPKKD